MVIFHSYVSLPGFYMLVLTGKHGEIIGDGSRPMIFGQDPAAEMRPSSIKSSHGEKNR